MRGYGVLVRSAPPTRSHVSLPRLDKRYRLDVAIPKGAIRALHLSGLSIPFRRKLRPLYRREEDKGREGLLGNKSEATTFLPIDRV